MEQAMPRKPYKRITFEDRQRIEKMCSDGMGVFEIAREIGVHSATMYRELGRGGIPYRAEVAQRSL